MNPTMNLVMTNLRTALFFCLALLLFACDAETESEVSVNTGASASPEDLISEERDVPDFNRVRLETMGDLNLSQGDKRVVLELSPKYEGVIETEVEGDTLIIRSSRSNMTQINRDVLRYSVTLPELEEVALEGSGDVRIKDFSTEDMTLALGGSGDVTAEGLEVEGLELALGGSGDLRVTGRADTLTLGLAGSGDIGAQGLRANQVEVGVAGSGDVSVCALEFLEVGVAGSGDVTYYGAPERPDVSVMGSGEVSAAGECP